MGLTRPKIAQVNTVVTSISDPISVLNLNSTQANIDIGFIMNRTGGTIANVALFWDESANTFVTAFTNNSGAIDANVVIEQYANLRSDNITANTITANYFVGDGSFLTGLGEPDNIKYEDSNVTVTTDYVNVAISSVNVASFSDDGLSVTGNLRLLSAPLAAIYGGTGINSYAKGDILYASDTNILSVLAAGNDYELLQIDANGVPSWDTIDGGTY
jgi:hypothetical protein